MNKISISLWWFYYFNYNLLEKLNYIKQFNNFNWVEIHIKHWYKFNKKELYQLKKYKYNTLHLNWYNKEDEDWLKYCIKTIPNFKHFVLHPDSINLEDLNKELIQYISFENMDPRKEAFQTDKEMNKLFKQFPNSKFTLDINHLEENNINIDTFKVKKEVNQIHFSVVNKNYYKKYNYINTSHALSCLEKDFNFKLKKYKNSIITIEWVYVKYKPNLIQKEINLISNLLKN